MSVTNANMENNFRKTWLFSHNDLDGYGCNVVARAFLLGYTDDLVEANCDYQNLEFEIRHRMPEIEKDHDLVIVSDVSWKKDSTDITDFLSSLPEGHLVVADHHKTSEWIGEAICRATVVTVEGERCGCEILKDILKGMRFFINDAIYAELTKFTSIVSGWDLWKWADLPEALSTTSIGNLMAMAAPQLSSWFEWCILTGKDFVGIVDRHLCESDQPLMACLEDEYRFSEFKKYLKSVRDTLYDAAHHYYRFKIPCETVLDSILFVLPSGCQHKSLLSMVAERRLKSAKIKDYDCIAIWVEGDDNLSLRYPQNGLDLSKVMKTCTWGGGGHKGQAGTNPGSWYMESFCSDCKRWNF